MSQRRLFKPEHNENHVKMKIIKNTNKTLGERLDQIFADKSFIRSKSYNELLQVKLKL